MIRYIGLDFEASGSNPWGEHAPIQIGMAAWAQSIDDDYDRNFESLIGGWDFKNEYEWNAKAFEVHSITLEQLKDAPRLHEVDVRAAAWMYERGLGKNRMWNVTVGWNVAGYDRQFITRHMPNLNQLLSYRTIDLNALVFLLANGQESEYMRIKGLVKQYANNRLLISEENGRHNALIDARAALFELEALQKLQRGETNLLAA